MINSEKANKLIEIYMFVCDHCDKGLKNLSIRHSNNNNPCFTEKELLTVHLFYSACEKHLWVKDKHTFAKEYLSDWFHKLPSYQTFNKRLNKQTGVQGETCQRYPHLVQANVHR